MTQNEAKGAQKRSGDYLIGEAVELAEGMYALRHGALVWQAVEDENVHTASALLRRRRRSFPKAD